MTEFLAGDTVRVELPRGYSKRGVLGISVLFTTSPEARFQGAVGRVTQINPRGPHTVHQYLVDFRGHDNSKLGIPWQAHWFREEWLTLVESGASVAEAARSAAPAAAVAAPGSGGDEQSPPVTAGAGPGRADPSPAQDSQETARLASTGDASVAPPPSDTLASASSSPSGAGPTGDADRPSVPRATLDASPATSATNDMVSSAPSSASGRAPDLAAIRAVEHRSARGLTPMQPSADALSPIEHPSAHVDGDRTDAVDGVPPAIGVDGVDQKRDATADTLADLLALDRAFDATASDDDEAEIARQAARDAASAIARSGAAESADAAGAAEGTPQEVGIAHPGAIADVVERSKHGSIDLSMLAPSEPRPDDDTSETSQRMDIAAATPATVDDAGEQPPAVDPDASAPRLFEMAASASIAETMARPTTGHDDAAEEPGDVLGESVASTIDVGKGPIDIAALAEDPAFSSEASATAPELSEMAQQAASDIATSLVGSGSIPSAGSAPLGAPVAGELPAEPAPSQGTVGRASGPGWVRGDGSRYCPPAFPIKGNERSMIYHRPSDDSYAPTIPEVCFAGEPEAAAAGYRSRAAAHPAPAKKDHRKNRH